MPLHWEPSVRPRKTVPTTSGGKGGGGKSGGGGADGGKKHGFVINVPLRETTIQWDVV
jgi:hypothetical protein